MHYPAMHGTNKKKSKHEISQNSPLFKNILGTNDGLYLTNDNKNRSFCDTILILNILIRFAFNELKEQWLTAWTKYLWKYY
jgi:hypothetical protein